MKNKLYALLVLLATPVMLASCSQTAISTAQDDRLEVIATVFPAYDFARTIGGDLVQVSLLLPPGTESHSYEPTPADMIAVQNCDLFLYLGGESDAWVNTILDAIDFQGIALKLTDCVTLLEEDHMDDIGQDHAHEHDLGSVKEYDEHVWTSPKNAATISRAIGQQLQQLDPTHADLYAANTETYTADIDTLDTSFRSFFAGVSNPTLLFGDRFPLRYFAEEYDISYYAAFPGCSTQTEPSAATIAFLIETVQKEHLSTVFYIEFSNHLVADSIAEAAGVQTACFHTCHNVSQEELDSGATYLSLMQQNLEVLQQAMT